jgi:protein-tyrosine phosphatase
MGFTDIHSHLLSGVDDGCRSLEESLDALRRFRRAGVERVALTSHLGPSWGSDDLPRRMAELRGAYERLREAAAAHPGLPELRFGQEVFGWDAAQFAPMLEHPDVGFAGTRWLLVEFGFSLAGRPDEVLELARASGREVIVAHPERYRYPEGADPLEILRRWRDLGAALQVNLGSLTGYYDRGGEMQRLAWRILEEGLAHVLSSDDHGEGRPQTYHREIAARLEARGGAEQAELLLVENPARVLRGESPLEVAPLPAPALAAAG